MTDVIAQQFFDYHVYWHFLLSYGPILDGVKLTIILAVMSQAAGIILGVFTALGRLSKLFLLRWIAGIYIWLFRGTPLLVQLVFVYFAVPQMTNFSILIDAFWSGFIALSLNEGAYMAEIVRAGIAAVDAGQMEAAQSLGMTRGLVMRRIVLPQAIRIIIPPTGNEFISMLKNTSLASVITVYELFYQTQLVYSSGTGPGSQKYFELIAVAATWYLAMTTVFSFLQGFVERHYERGFSRDIRGPGALERALGGLAWRRRGLFPS